MKPEAVSWLWPGRMARGKYQVIVGDPDLGKTTIALDCAARLSIGGTWPDGTPAPQGRTLILTAEDGVADTIRPRIDTLGGDSSQVAVLEAIRDDRTSGAVAFVAAARLGWVVASHPDDPERLVMAMFKHNLCAKAPSLIYELDGGGVTWDVAGGDITAETLLQSSDPEDRGEQLDAVAFLEDILEGGTMKQTDVITAAKKNGIAERTLKRAKRRIGVQVTRYVRCSRRTRAFGRPSRKRKWNFKDSGPCPPSRPWRSRVFPQARNTTSTQRSLVHWPRGSAPATSLDKALVRPSVEPLDELEACSVAGGTTT